MRRMKETFETRAVEVNRKKGFQENFRLGNFRKCPFGEKLNKKEISLDIFHKVFMLEFN